MQPVIKNYNKILNEITFQNIKIAEIKIKYLSRFDNSEENQEARKNEIVMCLLLSKYKNRKLLYVTTKNDSIKFSLISSEDLNVSYFSEVLKRNDDLVSISLTEHMFALDQNKLFRNVHANSSSEPNENLRLICEALAQKKESKQ